MNGNNGDKRIETILITEDVTQPKVAVPTTTPGSPENIEPVTRARLRARQKIQQNRIVIVAAGGVVLALLVFAFVSAPRSSGPRSGANQKKSGSAANLDRSADSQAPASTSEKSVFPIIDSGRPTPNETHDGYLSEQDLDRSATRKAVSRYPTAPPPVTTAAGSLGSIPPFGEQGWQAPPYETGMAASVPSEAAGQTRSEREPWDKPSLVFVRNVSGTKPVGQQPAEPSTSTLYGLGLPTGTRLRAHLESAASTAVRTPVLAVIEYNYEREGEIVVPAGSKAVGQVQEADRSGYMRIQFDSLLLPDGATIPIQAAATDLRLRPVKGKVEGKNTGKNVLVRSLSGIGQASTILVGRGSLNQPLSESDLIRERVSNNIGQASDEEISRLAVTSRVVVTVSAGTPVYVVLEQMTKTDAALGRLPQGRNNPTADVEELRQLLTLQRELNATEAYKQ